MLFFFLRNNSKTLNRRVGRCKTTSVAVATVWFVKFEEQKMSNLEIKSAASLAKEQKLDFTTEISIPRDSVKRPVNQGKNEDYEVVVQFGEVGTETYSLMDYPAIPQKTLLARFYREEILREISLDKVVEGMISSANLMKLAYCALAARGTDPLLADVSELQGQLREATSTANVTMGTFVTNSKKIANLVNNVFNSFTEINEDTGPNDPTETLALKDLETAADYGQTMADESKALADKFQEIIESCSGIISRAITTKVNDAKAKEELEAKLRETEALIKATEVLQQNLEQSLQEVEKAYNEAKEKEALEGERAFITGLVGAVFSGIATTVGSVAQTIVAVKFPVGLPGALSGGSGNASQSTTTTNTGSKPTGNKPQAASDDKDETSEKLRKANKEVLDIQKEQENNEQAIKDAKKVLNDSNANAEAKEKAAEIQKEAEQKKVELEERLDIAQKAVDNLVQGALAVSENLSVISQNSYDAAAEASRQKMEYYKQKVKLAEQNRKSLRDISLYSSQVQYTTIDVEKIKTAIESLEFAIRALNGVVAALTETQRFWEALARFCRDKLASQEMADKITTMLKTTDPVSRMKYYRDERKFVLPALQTIAHWVAVNSVCNEYLAAVDKTYQKVLEDIRTRPSTEEAKKQLSGLATQVFQDTAQQTISIDREIAFYEEQMLQAAVSYNVNKPLN
jgi:hypothetical protein